MGLCRGVVSEYDPGVRQLFGRLTGRQREMLVAAVRAGYYDAPRRATHTDYCRLFPDCADPGVGAYR
ncbi:hypothetical protein BRC79_06700 [Halobacteriales archaeon QH_8_67_27]|nr:MAG: hypothetical protein BRC79_06700 [Halobacteriales archaeon QH_8_67_27]